MEFEHELQLQDAGRRHLHGRVAPVYRDGAVEGISVMVLDQTERRRLIERDAQRAAIVAAVPDAIITKTPAGIVTSWNAGAERLYGYSAAQMVGKSVERIMDPRRGAEYQAIWDEVLAGRPVENFETARLHRDGRSIEVVLSAAPILDGQGRVVTVATIERDVTARKRADAALRASEERLQAIIDNSPLVVFIKDLAGRYTLANRAYLTLFGTTAEELLGKSDDERGLPEDFVREVRANDRAVVESGAPQTFEESALILGERRTYVSTKFPLRDREGAVYALCGISTDITEQKRQEEALREADRRKDQFLSMLAHELRNPLAPIANAVQVLRLQGDALAPRVAWAAQIIERQTGLLTHLVDDLLDIARIASGRIQLRRVTLDPAAVVRQAADNLRARYETCAVGLHIELSEDPLVVEADEGRLVQVVDNLLDNAAKYTDAGGTVRVSLAREGEEAVLRVRDTGIGIDAHYLPRVFDLFEQADTSLDRAAGGLGLGLNLVKRLAEMHGGRVEAYSAGSSQGSEFVVRLPLARAATTAASAPAAQPPSEAPPRRVLVIEDNADVAASTEMLLTTLGHEVQVAASGQAGLAAAVRFQPHLVLMDLGLPDMSGYEVARALRARLGPAPRLVAVSGYGQEEHRRRSREAGCDEHLVKPPTLDALQRALAAAPMDREAAS